MYSPTDYLRHILDETDYLFEQSARLSQAEFLSDETMKRAFVRSLEIIGEATKSLPDDFRATHADVPWRSLAGLRDRLIHGYFGVDYEIVWDVVATKIPDLRETITRILEDEDSQ